MRQHGGAFRGVAMHHRHRMPPVVAAEERLADPQHVVLGLLVARAAGMQAGVDEDVVPDAALPDTALHVGLPLRSEPLVPPPGPIAPILQAVTPRQGFPLPFPPLAPPL